MRKRLWLAVFQEAMAAGRPGPISEELIANAVARANQAYDGICARFPLPNREPGLGPIVAPTPLGEDDN